MPDLIISRPDFMKVQNFKKILWEDTLKIDSNYCEKILIVVKKAENWSNSNGTINETLSNDLLKLLLFDKMQKQAEILKLGKQLLTYEDRLSSKEINKITGILYNVYRQLEAYNEITKLIPLLEKYQDIDKGWRALGFTPRYDIAMINYRVQNYERAAKGFWAQKKIFDSIGNQLYVSSMFNNIGLCYYNLKKYDEALKYYNKSLYELEKSNKKGVPEESDSYKNYFKWVIKANIADIDFEHGKYEKALRVYKKTRKASIVKGEYPIKTGMLIRIAKVHMALKNPHLSEKYADSAIASINKYIDTDTQIDIYNLKGKVLLLSGDTEKSMGYFSKAEHINDSIKQLKISRDNLVAKVKYEMEEKEQDLEKAKQTVYLKEKIEKQQKLVIIFTGLLLFIISYLYYKSRINKRTIDKQRKSLQASVKEKEILLKEIHHRVKNNLQVISGLLSIQSKRVNTNNMLNPLAEIQKHICSIAIIHEMLYHQEDSAEVNMEEYLKKLSQHLIDPHNKPSIRVTIIATTINLSINRAIPIGLMVNELITNSIKHGFNNNKGTIVISIQESDPSEYTFIYSDNGRGLPSDYENHLSKTMGFRLIKLLVEEMNGEIEIVNQAGLKIIVQFS